MTLYETILSLSFSAIAISHIYQISASARLLDRWKGNSENNDDHLRLRRLELDINRNRLQIESQRWELDKACIRVDYKLGSETKLKSETTSVE